ncbi:MAG: ribonuclease HIII [Verrucomicrobiota bacterium]
MEVRALNQVVYSTGTACIEERRGQVRLQQPMPAKPRTTYTEPLTTAQADQLRALLGHDGFTFTDKPYALYAAAKGKLNVTVYEKGPKVLVQGKETEEFVRFRLEPEILGEAKLGYEEERNPEMFLPHFGIDESGKGDFFGPLVIAGAYTDGDIARHLIEEGIQDSKRITSDAKIRKLAGIIRGTDDIAFEVISIGPERYNELYASMGNLNKLLAWGHARVLENLCTLRPDCPHAISDQFANPRVLQSMLLERGKNIELTQKTKAESDVAVAAASILAREAFINSLDRLGEEFEIVIPKGAGAQVNATAAKLTAREGVEILNRVAKTHFRNALKVRSSSIP